MMCIGVRAHLNMCVGLRGRVCIDMRVCISLGVCIDCMISVIACEFSFSCWSSH